LNKVKFSYHKIQFGFFLVSVFSLIYISGCSSSASDDNTESDIKEAQTIYESEIAGNTILSFAETEQQNPMYSPEVDSTFLYWLNNDLLLIQGSTKCNIFVLNVLNRAGFKTPKINALCRDLFDTVNFNDIIPMISMNDISTAVKGDLVIWSYHVIIFESLKKVKDDLYVVGWWAGTRQQDNGDNIVNNVCHGKYRLEGEYIVRRPVKKN